MCFCCLLYRHFYPRSPRGERLIGPVHRGDCIKFLSTLPARGATHPLAYSPLSEIEFLSTLPARGATVAVSFCAPEEREISIHAPREGSDLHLLPAGASEGHFYPRSPRGERQMGIQGPAPEPKFLSTLPARGATIVQYFDVLGERYISIHAPREGSDCIVWAACPRKDDISIHAPREGSDLV